ncbi:hypothetical protein MXB_3502 [Myxobolus squamalis]|nr:hypothetical protein MXB_3502 [Myxobolus squamalis]
MTDETIAIVRSNQHVFIDATLKLALHLFMQLLIVMGHDKVKNVYVPYAALDSCSDRLHLRAKARSMRLRKAFAYSYLPRVSRNKAAGLLLSLVFEQEEICKVMQNKSFFCNIAYPDQRCSRFCGGNLCYNKIFEYFKRTWIEKFQIQLCSSYGIKKHLIARTNNGLERYNRCPCKCVVFVHLNIFVLIQIFKEEFS